MSDSLISQPHPGTPGYILTEEVVITEEDWLKAKKLLIEFQKDNLMSFGNIHFPGCEIIHDL